jgi:hypothetical protein
MNQATLGVLILSLIGGSDFPSDEKVLDCADRQLDRTILKE